MKKILETYLKHLGGSKVSLFVTTNDLAGMAFCPNTTYLQVNFFGGISEYDFKFNLSDKEKNSILDLFEKGEKIKWWLTENTLRKYFLEELWSFSFIPKALDLFPNEIKKIKIELPLSAGMKKLIDRGIFYSRFRINFVVSKFFLSAVPDVVFIKNGKIKGIIEVKSTQKALKQISPSEYEQVDFYRYYITKRKLPIYKNAWFLTIKGRGSSPNEIEERVVNFLASSEDVEKEDIFFSAHRYGYLLKESTDSLNEIERKLNERIKLLLQQNLPNMRCRWKTCGFRNFCEKLGIKFF
jgi:hypothetical protein